MLLINCLSYVTILFPVFVFLFFFDAPDFLLPQCPSQPMHSSANLAWMNKGCLSVAHHNSSHCPVNFQICAYFTMPTILPKDLRYPVDFVQHPC